MIPAQKNAWLPLYEPALGAEIRLFCFPHAGGSAQFFRSWQKLLGPRYDLCAVQPPGRWNRYNEPAIQDLQVLVEAAVRHLGAFLPDNFALFGHSVGALVAFEFARALRRNGLRQPRHLLLAGRRAPQSRVLEPAVETLSDEALVAFIADRFGAIPEVVLRDPDMLSVVIPLLRADLRLAQGYNYVHEPPLACPITVMGGASDRTTSHEQLEAWREHTSDEFRVQSFPGGHFFLETSRDAVLKCLDERCRESSAR